MKYYIEIDGDKIEVSIYDYMIQLAINMIKYKPTTKIILN